MSDKTKDTKKELKKFRITAVIPTVQYGNIQPEYEIEAESFEKAHDIAMPYVEGLWNKYCQPGSELKPNNSNLTETKLVELVSVVTKGKAFFDEANHVYTNKDGKRLLGGSTFAKQFCKPFEKDAILAAMEKKYDIPKEQIAEMWELKGDVSSGFGTAVHKALELYGRFHENGKATGANKDPIVNDALHDHPLIKPMVEDFFKGREKEKALYEPFVIDEKRLLCGQIDRLLIKDKQKMICRVQDFKTNADIDKVGKPKYLLAPFDDVLNTTINGYWLQLSFYSELLRVAGWTVEGMDMFHHDGKKWNTYSEKPWDISKGLEG